MTPPVGDQAKTLLSIDAVSFEARRPMISYRCPHCSAPLAEEAAAFACANGHRFDRAKEGYVNLLPGGRLRGRPSGDDEAMVRARRTVFDAGLYAPIMDAAAAAVEEMGAPPSGAALRVLDCGSGEGSYLAAVAERVGADAWGVDISKPAVRLAARRHRRHHHAVASTYQLPFADAEFDVLLSVFSPRPRTEMMRVLRAEGHVVIVRPGPEHLAGLKALVYDEPRQHRDPATPGDGDDWPTPLRVDTVQFDLALEEPALRLALLEMTPYWWSARPDRRDEIAAVVHTVGVDVRIAVFGHAG